MVQSLLRVMGGPGGERVRKSWVQVLLGLVPAVYPKASCFPSLTLSPSLNNLDNDLPPYASLLSIQSSRGVRALRHGAGAQLEAVAFSEGPSWEWLDHPVPSTPGG